MLYHLSSKQCESKCADDVNSTTQTCCNRHSLTHSFSNEHPDVSDNERLEWLGDGVLQLDLYAKNPQSTEADMTRMRARCVSNARLSACLPDNIANNVRKGRGVSRLTVRMRASVLQAMFGAFLLDGRTISELTLVRHSFVGRDEHERSGHGIARAIAAVRT